MSNAHLVVVKMLDHQPGLSQRPPGDDPSTPWSSGTLWGTCPVRPLQSRYPAGRVIYAVMSVPPARAGGAEHPSGICGQILLLLRSHSPITVSRTGSVKYTEVVTIPCGVHVGLEMPELMEAAFPEIFVY